MSDPKGLPIAVECLGDEVYLQSLHYDLAGLSLCLKVENRLVEVCFHSIQGLRMLNEGDLLEFWAEFSLSNGWLYQLSEGGWFALESNRSGFMASGGKVLNEFLIVTRKECVSVLSAESMPSVRWG
ncbi:hypothetical protein [Shewanella sedimentimangrovi]|uniref:Uncharacterized protein n=1 Tax=Shewanella sedimentimangrovi TaxID=2814293 RepID=A0ABX7R0K3_9GAMM|nr:hypothetical protein [Shewanella sedimentimangrovi]QSX36716.1 hypothetical protein JYB85_15780 [Shewanella sedimentimangrovi]